MKEFFRGAINTHRLLTVTTTLHTCNMLFHPSHNNDYLQTVHRMQYIGSVPDENSSQMP